MKLSFLIKKLGYALAALLLILVSTVISPKTTHAQLVVHDPINLVPLTTIAGASGITAANTGITAVNTTLQTTKEHVEDGIFWVIGRIAIQSLTNSLVHWINSGFQGSPGFVTNLDNTMMKVGDTVALNFINQLGTTGTISSPFQTQVAQAAQQNYFASTGAGGFFNQHPFTLGQTSTNTTAFLSGNFAQGGWNAWISAATHPENNAYGANMLAQQALINQVNSAKNTRLTELNWGKGFLSWRGSCAATGQADSGAGSGKACKTDDDCAGTLACISGKCQADASLDSPVSLQAGDSCLAYNIQTPGSVIESQLEKTFGSNIDSLVTADEFNEVIGALMGQLMSHVLGGTGLAGLSQPSGTGTSSTSFIDQATNPNQFSGVSQGLSGSFITTVNNQESEIKTFQANWQKINTAAQAAKTTCTTTGNQTVIASTVQPAIDTSTANLAQAATSITALEKIKTEASTTPPAGGDPTIYVLQASTDYTTLLSSGTLPDDTAIQNAVAQSTDTGTSTPSSLYTQMNNLAQNSCVAGT